MRHGILLYSPEVWQALQARAPVVALESTIISHGMPFPQNLETAQQVCWCPAAHSTRVLYASLCFTTYISSRSVRTRHNENAELESSTQYTCDMPGAHRWRGIVRDNSATPATIAVLDGVPHIGLTVEQLHRIASKCGTAYWHLLSAHHLKAPSAVSTCSLSSSWLLSQPGSMLMKSVHFLLRRGKRVRKTSRRDLPAVMAARADGATTVSATMLLAAHAGIAVFVTGGAPSLSAACRPRPVSRGPRCVLASAGECSVMAGMPSLGPTALDVLDFILPEDDILPKWTGRM